MEKYFADYGILNYLSPNTYFDEPWSYVGYEVDENGEEWDIVYNRESGDYAYTNV